MKVESGGVATSSATSVLHKIKVKEEAKECCPSVLQQAGPPSLPSSSSTATPSPSRGAPGVAIGAIATITIGSGCGEIAAAVAKQSTTSVAETFPIDLDLKSKAKCVSRDKQGDREDGNGTESRYSSTPSPSSSPGSQCQQQSRGQHQSARAASSSSSIRSADSDDQTPTSMQPVKSEQSTLEERAREKVNTMASRRLSGIFATHIKLKRLLGTLVQFATDISADTRDAVRTLILGLLSGSMSPEEFHSALQEATNFPLRGFVLPYLKHTLPPLQRDLSAAARAENQTCSQYLRSNEVAVLDAVGMMGPNTESVGELFAENAVPGQHFGVLRSGTSLRSSTILSGNAATAVHFGYGAVRANKRRASEALYYENGAVFDESAPYAKRGSSIWSNHQGHYPHHHQQQHLPHHQQQQQHQHQQQPQPQPHPSEVPYCWYPPPIPGHHPHAPNGSANSHMGTGAQSNYGPLAQPTPAHLPHQQASISHAAASASGGASVQNGSASLDDEWRNIYVMLNCILGMVEKTKRALAILQRRGCSSPAGSGHQPPGAVVNGTQGATASQPQQQLDNSAPDREGTFKRLSGEIVAQTIKATEDRVAEVKRKAEEAVQEVKRAAVAEVQRAVAVAIAESRASERLRSQQFLESLPMSQQQQQQRGRPSPFLARAEASTASSSCGDEHDKDAHLQGAVVSSCWNCGRAALETCGGCGIARYCGSFCQHRDWEAGGHHASCSNNLTQPQQQQQHQQELPGSVSPTPPRASSATSDHETTSAPRGVAK